MALQVSKNYSVILKLILMINKIGSIINNKKRVGYLFILPSLTIFIVFVFVPMIVTVFLSFFSLDLMGGNLRFIDFDNYLKLFKDERFWNSLINTVYYVFATVPVQVLIAILVAVAISRKSRSNNLLRSIYFLPAIASMTVISIIWTFLLDNDIGIITYYLSFLGIRTIGWLKDPDWAMPAIIIVSIWKTFGFNMVILLAGLKGIPDNYYEAAQMDGANNKTQFFSITLPLLMPTIGFVSITSVISSFQVFDQVFIMTRGGPLFKTETLVYYIYTRGFEAHNLGYASAIAQVLFIIILFCSVFMVKSLRKNEGNF